MENLPVDLLSNVVSRVTIEDVENIRTAVAGYSRCDAIRDECDAAVSVRTYLQRNFGHADELLRAMSKNFVLLSGSRALEYFVPGSANEDSDWDFFMHGNPGCTSSFLRDMESIGVKWRSPADEVLTYLRSGSGSMRVSVPVARRIMTDQNLENELKAAGYENAIVHEPLIAVPGGSVYVKIRDGKVTFQLVDPGEGDYPFPSVCNIQGTITIKGVDTKVQLIVGDSFDPLSTEFLHGFHSSCVCCIISAHIAIHYYGKTACAKESYVWPSNSNTPAGTRAVRKYEGRGFREKTLRSEYKGFIVRCADDEECVVSHVENHAGAPPGIEEAYRATMLSAVWYQDSRGTSAMELPDKYINPRKLRRSTGWFNVSPRYDHALAEAWGRNMDHYIHAYVRGGGTVDFGMDPDTWRDTGEPRGYHLDEPPHPYE